MSGKAENKNSSLATRPTDALSRRPQAKPVHRAGAAPTQRATPPGPKKPSGWAQVASVVFGACLVASIVAGFVLKEVTGVVAIAAPAFLVAMAFTRLDLFESIKGAGIELKLREAEKAVEEAKATVEQVRALGRSLSKASLEMLGRASLLGEFPWSEKIRLRNALKDELRDLGVAEDEIADADQTFAPCSVSSTHIAC